MSVDSAVIFAWYLEGRSEAAAIMHGFGAGPQGPTELMHFVTDPLAPPFGMRQDPQLQQLPWIASFCYPESQARYTLSSTAKELDAMDDNLSGFVLSFSF